MKGYLYLYLMAVSGSLWATPPSDPLLTSSSEIAALKTVQEVPVGPEIFGVFRGRTPCQELSAQLNVSPSEACNKIKCRLTLYQNPTTKTPTTYTWSGKTKWTGKWSIIKGTTADPNAVVYFLEPGNSNGFLAFLEVNENVLFFLNRDGGLLVGNSEFSYTLNRIIRK